MVNMDEMEFASVYTENFREGNLRHQDQVEIFDGRWLHTINGSYWLKVESKEDKIEGLIEKYEKETEDLDLEEYKKKKEMESL